MIKLNSKITDEYNFFGQTNPFALVEEYGSPLYIYNETIIRQRAREMKNLVSYKNFKVNYSAKANTNLAFLQIINDEGLNVDAMSPGEIQAELKAGFKPEDILYISNNVSEEEMKYAIERDIITSVDSVSQLEQFGKINPGGKVAIRFNPGVGAGHHEKVITGGKNTKFGVNAEYIPEVKEILKKYNLKLVGINQHIGSLFMDAAPYTESASNLLGIAKNFDDIEFIDLGGGFGIPYKKQEGEARLDLKSAGKILDEFIHEFAKGYGKEVTLKIEPGRYLSAESGVLLGQVHAVKFNGNSKYIGTDLGFNVLARPVMYDSHHEVEIYRNSNENSGKIEEVSIVGNICETGDIIAKNRTLPEILKGDIIGVLDAGAYGFVMSSNYNNRLRCAEVLIREDGQAVLVRERDKLEDLLKPYKMIEI